MKEIALVILFGLTVIAFGCKDDTNASTCEFYKRKGYCLKVDWLAKKCKRTCGLCGCSDELDSSVCRLYKKRGFCVNVGGVASKCLRTCDLCNPNTTTPFTAASTSKPVQTVTMKPVTSKPSAVFTSKPTLTTSRHQITTQRLHSTTQKGQSTTPSSGGKPECGTSSIRSRVISGTTSRLGQWPWQGMLAYKKIANCGASLVSPDWVVTAAHCIYNKSAADFQVTFGKLHRWRSSNHEQTRGVQYIIRHEQHRTPVRVYNDIALMKLSTPVLLNKYVNTVCLPAQGISAGQGDECYISGWGKTMHPGFGAYELHHAKLKVLPQSECIRRNKNLAPVIDSMICGANPAPKRQSACHGDSGGPFVCRNSSGKWVLQGAISWGSPVCKIQKAATVFTKISAYRDWIEMKIGLKHKD